MRIGLVTDSNSDLPTGLVIRHRIAVIPAILVLDGRAYRDGPDISRREFYERLPALSRAPTTAAPALAEFAGCFRKMLEAGHEHVLGIFTAEKLTAISNIARLAAGEFPGQVTVLESGSLSMGCGYQVLAAAEAVEDGLDLSEALARVRSTRERCRVYAALDTIDYLRRSGRIPQAFSALGGLLRIKPVMELREGVIRPIDAPRTTSRANRKLAELLDALKPVEKLAILHSNAENRASQFLAELQAWPGLLPPGEILLVNVTSVIGTHAGPGGLGIAVVRQAGP